MAVAFSGTYQLINWQYTYFEFVLYISVTGVQVLIWEKFEKMEHGKMQYQLHVLEEGRVVDVGALVVPRVQRALGGGESVPGGSALCYNGVLQCFVIVRNYGGVL
jgi:hypothetical protein